MLNSFKLTRFAFEVRQKFEAFPSPREYKSFSNPSETQQRCNKYLTNLVFSIRTVSYGSSIYLRIPFDLWGKISVRNLQYGPRTRLVRGMYVSPKAKKKLAWNSEQFMSGKVKNCIDQIWGMRKKVSSPVLNFPPICL